MSVTLKHITINVLVVIQKVLSATQKESVQKDKQEKQKFKKFKLQNVNNLSGKPVKEISSQYVFINLVKQQEPMYMNGLKSLMDVLSVN